jgi:hypothetical protein
MASAGEAEAHLEGQSIRDDKRRSCGPGPNNHRDFNGDGRSHHHMRFVPVPPTARPKETAQLSLPRMLGRRFRCHRLLVLSFHGRENPMKLTTIVLASALAASSSIALAQGAGVTGGVAATGAAGSSSIGSSTETTGISKGNATTGSSNGLSSGFSVGTYPTLTTPGGLPSSVPAPGVTISR